MLRRRWIGRSLYVEARLWVSGRYISLGGEGDESSPMMYWYELMKQHKMDMPKKICETRAGQMVNSRSQVQAL